MTQTPNLTLPFIAAAQAQKHVTHNEAIRALDAIVHLAVEDRDRTEPVAEPLNGERYLVADGATGAWLTHDREIAAFQDGAWMFYPPQEGWLAWVADEDRLVVWDGTAWVEVGGGVGSVNPAPLIGVNTAADATNKLSVKSNATLFSHDDVTPGTGDMRQILNKAVAGNTVSQLYQSNWSGRAETGLTGDDDFHVKVSPDGSTWYEAIVVDKDTGRAGFGTNSPEAVAHIKTSAERALLIGPGDEFLNDNHQVEIVGTGGLTPLMIAGGSGLIEFWKETSAVSLTAALSFGMAVPGNPVGEDFVVSGYTLLTGWQELFRVRNADRVAIMGGPMRVGSFVKASLPSASSAGAGALVFVPDASGGAVIAFSDGTDWRRVTDRAVVS